MNDQQILSNDLRVRIIKAKIGEAISNKAELLISSLENLGLSSRNREDLQQAVRNEIKKKIEGEVNEDISSDFFDFNFAIKNAIKKYSPIGLNDDLRLKVDTETKKIELEVEKWVDEHRNQLDMLRKKVLEDKIEKAFHLTNPKMTEEETQQVGHYKKLVSRLYIDKDLDKYKAEVFESGQVQGLPKERIKGLWVDLTGLTSSIKTTKKEFAEIREKHSLINERLKVLSKPYEIPEVKSFENLMSAVSDSTEIRHLINFNQRFVSVLKGADRIGIQQTAAFAKNSIALMEKRGFSEGIKVVLKGVVSGGVRAGTVGATSVGGAGGLAAVQAVPVVGQVILVVVVAMAVVKSVYKKIIRPIMNGIKSIFDYMGADLDSLGLSTKKTFEDILGRFFGGVANASFKIALGIVAIPTLIGGMSFGIIVAPVVIFCVVGLFGYQLYNSNLISSLVPPRRLGGEFITVVSPGYTGPVPEGCPAGWPVRTGMVTKGPWGAGSHMRPDGTGYEAVDVGAPLNTPIYATHKGIALPLSQGTDGCGLYISVEGTCNGTRFRTLYCHMSKYAINGLTEVDRGTLIGYVDSTGNSRGHHIHYDLRGLGEINDYLPVRVPKYCIGERSCGNIVIN